MNYRILGRTGLQVSEISMGCEGLLNRPYAQVKEFVDVMEEGGVNCVDLYAPDPDFRANLGKALRGRREKFVLQAHVCAVWKNGQYKRTRDLNEVREGFEDLLKRLETKTVEIGMIHYVDSMQDWDTVSRNGIIDYVQELKKSGIIGAIGLSSHNPEVALAAVNTGLIDVLMFSINPCYDLQPAGEDIDLLWAEESYRVPLINMDPQRQTLYETCQRLGVGITVMKAFGGGDLLSEYSPAGKALTLYQCLHYALTRPGVAAVMSGARSLEELKDSIAYADVPEVEKDYAAALAALPKVSWKGHCMYCGHCAPCSVGIHVADVTKFLNLAIAQGEIPETVREHYAALPHKGGECIQCGACDKRCPFEVAAMDNIGRATELFGE